MIAKQKVLYLKYKLHQSVFESINDIAYSTQVRPLCTTKGAVSKMLAHPTLSRFTLPNILGLNETSMDWEREKLDYISNLIIRVPRNGYKLDLSHSFEKDSPLRKPFIDKFIEDYKVKSADGKDASEAVLYGRIIKEVAAIDLHQYLSFGNVQDYLYWVLADNSSVVANKPEDVDKSHNIRFFIFDETVAEKNKAESTSKRIEAVTKLSEMKSGSSKNRLVDLALELNAVEYDVIEEFETDAEKIDYTFTKLFEFANDYPTELLDAANDADLTYKSLIKKCILRSLIVSDDEGKFTNTLTDKVIGGSNKELVNWFKNPLSEGEVNKLKTELKGKK